jgi:uncharacterized protein (TIRG00374 family)
VRWKIWIGIGASALLLWVAFRGVDLAGVGAALADLRPVWLVPVLLTMVARFWLTALRWQVLLRPVKRISRHRLFGVVMIGFMANNLLPARMGELVRAYALAKSEALPTSLSFATIVLERVFDGLTLLIFLVGGLLFLGPQRWLIWSAAGSLALYLVVLGGLVWLRRGYGLGRALAWVPERFRTRVDQLLQSFSLGLDVLVDPRALAVISGLSLLVWLVSVAGMWAMFVAFSLVLPLHAAFLVVAIVAVALVLPSAPGYVGAFQVGTVAALSLFQVPEALALSFSLVFHALNYVPITLVGLVYLYAMNLTLGELRAAGEAGR